MPVAFPSSVDVTSGTAVTAAERNALRADAIRFGQSAADAILLGTAMRRWSQHVKLEAFGTTKVRVPYDDKQPPTMMLNGCLLQAVANVDSPLLSGAAGTYYLMAVRTNGNTSFSLAWAATAVESLDQRLIGWVLWDGTKITQIKPLDLNGGANMKAVGGAGYKSLPASGSSLNLPTNTWVEFRAESGAPEIWLVGIGVLNSNVNFFDTLLEIGIGASGSETVISTVRVNLPNNYMAQKHDFPFPIPVAAGTRIAVRASTGGAQLNGSLYLVETANLIDI